jgi:hypothetical protein
MPRRLPGPLIAVLAGILENAETHGTMNQRFMYAGAPGSIGAVLHDAIEDARKHLGPTRFGGSSA